MSGPASDFSHLMQAVAEGDQDAVARFFHLYNNTLRRYVAIRLAKIKILQPRLDAEDITQTVWIAFLAGAARHKQFATPDQLVLYLIGMARNQLLKGARDHLDAQKRDSRRRQYLSEVSAVATVVADHRPTPAQHAEFLDEWKQWLHSLPSAEQQVILLIRDGFHYSEIAVELRCSVRTIERIIGEVRHHPPSAASVDSRGMIPPHGYSSPTASSRRFSTSSVSVKVIAAQKP